MGGRTTSTLSHATAARTTSMMSSVTGAFGVPSVLAGTAGLTAPDIKKYVDTKHVAPLFTMALLVVPLSQTCPCTRLRTAYLIPTCQPYSSQVRVATGGMPFNHGLCAAEETVPLELRPPLGSEWTELVDHDTQHRFFANLVTKETTWSDPRDTVCS